MTLSPQTDHSLRSLAILGLRHLRRSQLYAFEPRNISNDDLEIIGRCAVEAIETYLVENTQLTTHTPLGPRGQSADGFVVPSKEIGFCEKRR